MVDMMIWLIELFRESTHKLAYTMDLQEPQSPQRISFPKALWNPAGGGIIQNGYQHHGKVQQWQDSNTPGLYCNSVSPPHVSLSPVTAARGRWSGCHRTSASRQQAWVSVCLYHILCRPSSIPSSLFQLKPWLLWGCVIFRHTGYTVRSLSWPMWSSVGGNLSSWWAGPSQVSCFCFKTRIRRVLFLSVFSICLIFWVSFFPFGSSQNGAEDAAAVRHKLLFPCEIWKLSRCSFFPHSTQSRLCQAWAIKSISCFSEQGGVSFFFLTEWLFIRK